MKLSEVRRDPNIRKRGRFAVRRFCGWNALENFVKKPDRQIVRGLIAILFESGCRVSEVLQLRKNMFEDEGDFITIYGAPVLKKREGRPSWEKVRDIPIPKHERLIPYMMNWVDQCDDYLFESPYGGVYHRNWAWQQIVNVNESWWPHRVRSERATQLRKEYHYDVPALMRFFNWADPKEAIGYVRLDMKDLKEMMIKN